MIKCVTYMTISSCIPENIYEEMRWIVTHIWILLWSNHPSSNMTHFPDFSSFVSRLRHDCFVIFSFPADSVWTVWERVGCETEIPGFATCVCLCLHNCQCVSLCLSSDSAHGSHGEHNDNAAFHRHWQVWAFGVNILNILDFF